MFYLLYVVCATTLQLWTIHFVNDGENDEYITTDDLAKFNIGVFSDITEESRTAYGFDHSSTGNISNPSDSKPNPSAESHSLVERNDEITEEIERHYEIKISISKALFLKVTKLTLPNNVEFTATEMYDIFENILVFLKDKTYVLYTIYKNMLDNPDLFDELVDIYKSRGKKDYLFCVVLPSFAVEVENHIVLMNTDDSGNVVTASGNKNSKKPHIYTSINEIIRGLFSIHFFEMDIDFLLKNDKLLHSLYSELNNKNELTVTVHFTALKYTKPKNNSIKSKCKELSKSKFLQLERIKNVQLCFTHTNINFNLSFLKNKRIGLQFNNCVLSNSIHMPNNISEISLTYCEIGTKLDLPNNIDTIIFRNVSTSIDITINDDIRHIELINMTGNINITNVDDDFNIREYNANWSFKRIKKDKNTLKVLLMGNIVFKEGNIEFSQNIGELILENIELNNETIFIIRNNVRIIHLKSVTGAVNIYDSRVNIGLLSIMLNNGSMHISMSIQKDSAPNKNKRVMFELFNADIKSDVSLSQSLSRISLINVNISNKHKSLDINSTVDEIYIRNCNGSILFNGIDGLGRIHFTKNNIAKNEELLSFTRSASTTTLEMKRITFSNSITFESKINNINLRNIECSDNNVFTIHSYDSLIISKSKGKYRIPGISCGEENIIDIKKKCSLSIKSAEENTCDVEIKCMSVEQPYVFNLNINNLKLYKIKRKNSQGYLRFTGSCKSIELSYIFCAIEFTTTKSFDRIILTKISEEDTANTFLSMPAQHIEAINVKVTKDIILSDITKYVKIERINLYMPSSTNSITVNSNCEHVYVSLRNISINISAILQYTDSNDVFVVRDFSSAYELIATNTESYLFLSSFKMDKDLQLVKNIKSLELDYISAAKKPCRFNIIHELESISIKNCDIDVSLSCPDKLKYISINRSKMFYDPSVHTQIKCIHLINVTIDKTLVLPDVLEDIHMVNVEIERNMCIVLGKNTASLYVSGTNGTIDMSKSIINHSFKLISWGTIELKKIAPDEFSLYICGVYFPVDYEFSTQIKTVIINDIGVDAIFRISNIDRIEMYNYSSKIKLFSSSTEADKFVQKYNKDVSKSSSSTKANKFAQNRSSDLRGVFILLNVHTLKLKKKEFDYSIKLPSCIRTIIFEEIKMANGAKLVANKTCEEVHLLSCTGVFNLKRIKRLKRLVFVSLIIGACNLRRNDKCLNSLHELEIGGDVYNDYIIQMLSLCHNLKRLTLHNSMILYYNYGNAVRSQYKDEIRHLFICSNMDLLSKIFNFNMVTKLEYLDISRLSLDYRNVMLNDFKKLDTLIIDYIAIYQMSLRDIPNSIEILEFVNLYQQKPKIDIYEEYKKNNLEYLKTNTSIKSLTIPYILCEEFNTGHLLPPYLEKLIITSCNKYSCPKKNAKTTKSYVKELVLDFMLDYYMDKMIQNMNIRCYCIDFLDYLHNFIDFDKLETLAIKTKTDIIYLDTKTYKVK